MRGFNSRPGLQNDAWRQSAGIESRSDVLLASKTTRRGRENSRVTASGLSVTNSRPGFQEVGNTEWYTYSIYTISMRALQKHWEEESLRKVISSSLSVREALIKMGLRGAGGNYRYFEKYVEMYHIDIKHFLGKGWGKNKSVPREPVLSLEEILVKNSNFSIVQMKKRLFRAGLKQPKCEECGWAKQSEDGRIPIEIDHINGDHSDNRLKNLRILCPNCHSLKLTHRGRNKGIHAGVVKW